jgi:4-amino-4-deoxy-L-arabinose transferase-like glycosyltransferase
MVRHRVLILMVFTLGLFLAGVNRFLIFRGGDNAVYWLLGRYLAQGRGYAPFYAYPPEPSTKVPFFFPLMLAGVFRIFGEKVAPVKVLLALCAALSLAASYRMWDARGEKRIAFFAAVLLATFPYTLNYSAGILSEIPFAAWVCLTLVWAERALRLDSIKSGAFLLSLFFLLLAYFTRSAGIALLPALVAAALSRTPAREKLLANLRLAAAWTFPFLAAAGAWFLRDYLIHRTVPEYFLEFFIRNPSEYQSPHVGFLGMLQRFGDHALYYLGELTQTLWPWDLPASKFSAPVLGAFLALGMLCGWFRAWRRRMGAPEWFTLFYTGLIVIWVAAAKRFLIPVYPLLFFYFVSGLAELADWIKLRRPSWPRPLSGRAVTAALTLGLLGSNLIADAQFLQKMAELRQTTGFQVGPGFEIIATDYRRKRFLALAFYLRYSVEPEAVIYSRKPSLIALAADRKVTLDPLPPDPPDALASLEQNRVNYLLVDEVDHDVRDAIAPLLRAYPARFQLVYQLPGSQSLIYKFLPRGQP